MAGEQASTLVEVDRLQVHYSSVKFLRPTSDTVRAVDGVSFTIRTGETLGLVGESGCGKSTTGRAVIGLVKPTAGAIRFDGRDLQAISRGELRKLRSRMQIVFQDPYASLNPRMTVHGTIDEPLSIHSSLSRSARRSRIRELLSLVGLDPEYADRYPHEFSGGQRQRIGIARALAVEPDFIVCDEPVSALDVSIQSQIINLLADLRTQLGLTYFFIAHDLAVVRQISHRVAVMYLGQIVEIGDPTQIYARPAHPYTSALLSAVPVPDPKVERKRKRVILQGDLPSPSNPPAGCRFHTRCWLFQRLGQPDRCQVESPSLMPVGVGWEAACHFSDRAQDTAAGLSLTAGPNERKRDRLHAERGKQGSI